MYEEYFGLNRPPFRITPDTSLFYEGGRRGDILAALAYAVQRGEGIVKVVGEVGSGKTMLCRMLQQVLPEEVEIIYIANPSVSPEDILFVIASELHFDVDRDASKHELVARLQDYLLQRHAENRQVVLFIEEAQGMPLETLEEIRLLTNLETDQHKLLQIILFGQPELDENLSKQSIRQLRERITHEFRLAPLSAEEIHRYLNFRMREVGYTGPELINRKLAKQIAHHSEGLLRRVNILADKMLLAAYAGDTHTLTGKHLKEAVADSGFTRLGIDRQGHGPLFWTLVGLIVVLTGLLAVYKLQPEWLGLPVAGGGDMASSVSEPEQAPEPVSTASTILERNTEAREGPVPEALVDALREEADPENSMEEPLITASLPMDPLESVAGNGREEMAAGSKKNAQASGKLDKVNENQPVEEANSGEQSPGGVSIGQTGTWLEQKLLKSKAWLEQASPRMMSIQVMVRKQAAEEDLVNYLRNEWPLDLEQTHVFAVSRPQGAIFRVFYGEYATIGAGQQAIKALPSEVQANAPYLHSIYRMRQQLL